MDHAKECPAPKYFGSEGKEVFINSQFRIAIEDITTTSLEGETKKHG
jgi:hypothetical protein